MIKQDYLIRMIQEIISLIVNTILNKKKFRKQEWIEYDTLARQILGLPVEQLLSMDIKEIIAQYDEDPVKIGKIELAAMNILKLSEETENDILLKNKLRQNGLQLLKYVQTEGKAFSLQRDYLIKLMEING